MDGRRYHTTISHSRIQAYTRRPVSDVRSHNRTFASYVSNRQAQVQAAVVPQPKESRWQLRAWLARWQIKVGREQRLAAVSWLSAGLIIVSVFVPVASIIWQGSANYDLSSAKSLLTATPRDLQQKLQYNAGKQSWLFNQAAQPATGPNLSVGSLTYSASLPTDLQKGGLSLADTSSKVSLGFVPQFATAPGQSTDGHIVYPLRGSQSQLVYTLEKAGVKEDIVLYKAPGNTTQYSYQLQLPDSLEARLQSDGSVGIFGGNPTLFGNVSYGSNKDKALVEKARQHSTKNHLYYVIPAPTITGDSTASAKAHFILKGTELTVQVSGLERAHYPLSIDPSFVMNTTNCGWKTGNTGDNFDVSSCTLSRSTTSGGALNSWAYNNGSTTGLPSATVYTAAIMNGYMYVADVSNGGSAVSVAAISGSGVVGAFSSVTSPGNTGGSQLVAANGYLYVVGGINFTTVMMAKPSASNGGITSWTAVSSFATSHGETGAGATFYNGKIYVAGGCTSVVLSVCNNGDFTHYATVNGDGTLGTWQDGPSLPTAIYNTTLQAYNGFLYVVGGLTAASGHVGQTTVSYAAINADGSIGAWQSTASLPVGLGGVGAVITNGYLYAIGGVPDAQGNPGVTTTYMAQVYASGRLGPFQQTTSITNGRETTAVTRNGIVYILGGYNKIVTTGVTAYQDIQYAVISTTPGGISSYQTTGTGANSSGSGVYDLQANARSWPSVVAYGGYLYIIGGIIIGSNTVLNTILYAPINANGTVGTFQQTTKSLNVQRDGAAAVVANGYLYVSGGLKDAATGSNDANYLNDTEYAPINANGDITTAFTDDTTGFTTPRQFAGSVAYNNYLYITGGRYNTNSTSLGDVQYAPLAADGSIGAWQTSANALPQPEALPGVVASGGYMYVLGGNTGSTQDNLVSFTKFQSNGDVSTFQAAPSLIDGRWGPTVWVNKGFVYVAGGRDNAHNDQTAESEYAAICTGTNVTTQFTTNCNTASTPGTTSSWSVTTSLPSARHGAGGAYYNGFVYVVGGCSAQGLLSFQCSANSTTYNDVQYAQIYNNGGGADTNWAAANSLSSAVFGNMAVAANGYLYNMGGCAGVSLGITLAPQCTALRTTVSYAKINADGTLGAWATTNNMVDGDYLGAAVTYGGRIYVIGGCNAINSSLCTGTGYSNGVQFATICTGVNTPVAGCTGAGATSAWQYTYNNTTAASYTAGNGFNGAGRWYISAAASNAGYIYIAGGANANTTVSDASQVQYAKVNTDGTLGTWTNASVYSGSRVGPGLVVNGGYLYVLGGSTTVSSGTVLGDVQYASLNGSTGAVGTWSQTTGLAQQVIEANCEVLDGYLYAVGGAGSGSGAAAFNSTTQYAPIFANGTLGNWTTTPGYTNVSGAVGRAAPGAIANGYIYSVGGWAYTSNGASYNILSTKEVYYGALQSTPAIAHYSMQLNTDQPTSPVNFFTGTSPEANSVINFGFAGATVASPVFGSPSTTPSPTDGKKYPLSIAGDGISYYWLPITIDDSQSMAFGESSGSKITYFQLNYHPNSSMRLRGGKTFNGQQLQSLDAY